MPQATVTSHEGGYVAFQFAHDAGASAYRIYSSASGPNVDTLMKQVQASVANPSPVGGLSKFVLSDKSLGILDPTIDWWIRVVKLVSGVETPVMLSTPGTDVFPETADSDTIKQSTVNANFSGDADNGLVDFAQTETITISRVLIDLAGGSAYILSIVDADGSSYTVFQDTGTDTEQVFLSDAFPLAVGEKLELVTTGGSPSSYSIKVTKE